MDFPTLLNGHIWTRTEGFQLVYRWPKRRSYPGQLTHIHPESEEVYNNACYPDEK